MSGEFSNFEHKASGEVFCLTITNDFELCLSQTKKLFYKNDE